MTRITTAIITITVVTISPCTWRISAWRNSLLAVGWSWTTECTLGDLNSNLAVPWQLHGKPCGSPVTSDLSLNLSEHSVRVPFSHFVCATLCSASVGMNSGDLPPTWPLPAQQVVPMGLRTMVVAARTKVGKGNGTTPNTGLRVHTYTLASHCVMASTQSQPLI
ncbi:hypothetical protein E2C01_021456 [Portunus trituberculatus]|uniref:Uncharacterized protein n=1 Tax=Portunus trituberculatus TaxID=210409 RepID=A0A5B7E3B6_PORTR|nr:hypothetical protein [Portunus trituberculatus]